MAKKQKKIRKNVVRGIAHVKATHNNTLVTITDVNCAGVAARALPAGGQAVAVTLAPVGADVAEALDVLVHLAAQGALDQEVRVDDAVELGDLLVGELVGLGLGGDLRFGEQVRCV